MQLIENKQTRLQLWSRQARATRWGVSCVFPPADRSEEDILVAEANYTISYDAMIRVHYALGFGAVDELPDYGVLTREKTLLKYSDTRRPYSRGHYASEATGNVDKCKSILHLLGLKTPVLPLAIVFERLV